MTRNATIAGLGVLLLSCGLLACGKCVTASGKHAVQQRTVPSFTGLELSNSVDVKISIGATPSVTVEGDDNLLEMITTDVRNGVLKIDTRNQACFIRNGGGSLTVNVTVPKLTSVALNGSGGISSVTTIAGDALDVKLDGSGDINLDVNVRSLKTTSEGSGGITLRGSAAEHTASLAGSGSVDAAPLMTKKTSVEVDGSGSARVNAQEEIHASSNGSGDIEYFGHPKVANVSSNGSGEVQPGSN